jgi:hypothetical protein
MLDRLRTPFFLIAVALIFMATVIEFGSTGKLVQQATQGIHVSGAALPGVVCVGFVDALLLYTVLLMGLSLFVPERVQGRVQGIVSFVFSLFLIAGAVAVLLAVYHLLILMVTLLTTPIFGTIAYLAAFSYFNVTAARVTLTMAMTLKLLFAACLILAQQRFLKNKGLVLMIVSSLVATFAIELLHALVPGFLVRITDAAGAILALVVALVWGLLLLISSVISIAKAIT